MLDLGARVLAIELTVAAQAVDLRGASELGAGAAIAQRFVRDRIAYLQSFEQMPLPLEELATAIRTQPAPA
jgi:histidine ammonia-lyase